MFGTLIIQLPSQYEGGQLRVKHAGREHTFDFSSLKGCTGFHYAALYADCQHEVCAVTKGYRLCLVYNLIHVGSGHCPAPVDDTVLVRRTVDAVKEWAAYASATECVIALPLDHRYCELSLSFSHLKNLDRAKADLLMNALGEVKFDIYLCMLHINQHWAACGSEYTGYQADFMIEEEFKAECLVSPSGKKAESIKLDNEMIKPEGALDKLLEFDPDEEEVEEATGNEGATMEKWYSQAAFVLWPKQYRMDVLGLDTVAMQLNKSIEKYHPLQCDTAKWHIYSEACRKLISTALLKMPNAETTVTLLTSAIALGEGSLVFDLLGPTSSSTNLPTVPASLHLSNSQFLDAVVLSCSTYGWTSLQPCLKGLMEAGAASNVESCVQLLYRLVTSQPSLNPELKTMGQELALPVCSVLVEEKDLPPSSPLHYQIYYQPRYRSQDFVRNLLKTLFLVDCMIQLERVLQSFAYLPNRYPLETVLLPAAEEFHQWLGKKSDILLNFARVCIEPLEASTKAAVKEPSDWSQDVTLSCRCTDCTELQKFFKHPSQTMARFKVNEKRRKHLERQIKSDKFDCMHSTESGNPKTLVVTKTRKRLENMKQEQKKGLLVLSRLKALHEANSTEPSSKRPCHVNAGDEL